MPQGEGTYGSQVGRPPKKRSAFKQYKGDRMKSAINTPTPFTQKPNQRTDLTKGFVAGMAPLLVETAAIKKFKTSPHAPRDYFKDQMNPTIKHLHKSLKTKQYGS